MGAHDSIAETVLAEAQAQIAGDASADTATEASAEEAAPVEAQAEEASAEEAAPEEAAEDAPTRRTLSWADALDRVPSSSANAPRCSKAASH